MFELCDNLIGIYKTYNCTQSITIDPRVHDQKEVNESTQKGHNEERSTASASFPLLQPHNESNAYTDVNDENDENDGLVQNIESSSNADVNNERTLQNSEHGKDTPMQDVTSCSDETEKNTQSSSVSFTNQTNEDQISSSPMEVN